MGQEEPIIKRVGKFLLDIFQTVVIALAMFVIIYQFAAQPHQVRGASMEPNYHDGEYILTEKVSYYFNVPKQGDVVVFKFPQNRELDYIKRVIAAPGDTISIRNNKVYVNGKELDEPYLSAGTITSGHTTLRNGTTFSVPENEYIVMGDNRERSSDSREWGTVSQENVVGRAFLRYWPLSEVGFVGE